MRLRRIGRRRDGLFLGQLLGQSQKREDDCLLALLEDDRGLLGGSVPDRARLAGKPHRDSPYPWLPCSQFSVTVGKRQDRLNSAEVFRISLFGIASGPG